jgi:cyclophilin family peptidyl-prolyl cis-trans isomerase
MLTRNLSLTLSRLRHHVVTLVFGLLMISSSAAQSPSTPDVSEAKKKYNEATVQLRTAIEETSRTFALYYHSRAAEADKWRDGWQKAGEAGVLAARDLKDAAVEIFMNSNDPGDDVIAVAFRVCRESYEQARYDKAYEISNRLAELDDRIEYQLEKTKASLLTNRFDEVKAFFNSHGDKFGVLSDLEAGLLGQLDHLRQNFDRESEVREQEANTDDLPRVELETTKGKIVIELFENESPQTVGNFVNLVENGFYNGILFHKVERKFLAQAGGFTTQGPRNVSYRIYDEFKKEGARKHFRGSVSMASKPPSPNTGSSQFFVLAVPFPDLDDHHTVFGRVISDMDVVDSLEATLIRDEDGKPTPIEGCEYDQIISARVLRKRDHGYKPVRVTE